MDITDKGIVLAEDMPVIVRGFAQTLPGFN